MGLWFDPTIEIKKQSGNETIPAAKKILSTLQGIA
jgi:hypothetical protein